MSIKKKLENIGLKFSESYIKGSSFLFPDGSWLNCYEQDDKWLLMSHYRLDLIILQSCLLDEEEARKLIELNAKIDGETPRPRFLAMQHRLIKYTDNVCVINNGAQFYIDGNFIDLPQEMPSGKQLEQLIIYLDNIIYTNPVHKRVLDVSLNNEVVSFNLDEVIAEDIIKEIRKLYARQNLHS